MQPKVNSLHQVVLCIQWFCRRQLLYLVVLSCAMCKNRCGLHKDTIRVIIILHTLIAALETHTKVICNKLWCSTFSHDAESHIGSYIAWLSLLCGSIQLTNSRLFVDFTVDVWIRHCLQIALMLVVIRKDFKTWINKSSVFYFATEPPSKQMIPWTSLDSTGQPLILH